MKEIDLKPFCSKDTDRNSITTPFSQGEYTFATDGYIMVRVPRRPKVEARKNAPNAAGMPSFALDGEWLPIPDIDKEASEPCLHCQEKGKVARKDCPECDGEGTLEIDGDYHTYTVTCKSCDGEGTIETSDDEGDTLCPKCHGEKGVPATVFVPVGPQKFQVTYLKMLKALNAEICVPETYDPARFRFDGGDGLLMPMRS
jgi:hypothetical protein